METGNPLGARQPTPVRFRRRRAADAPVLREVGLGGERVSLRPVRAADAETAFRILHQRDEILRWLSVQGPESLEEMANSYGRWAWRSARETRYQLAICEASSGGFAGWLGLVLASGKGSCELGYWLEPRYWGRGFTSEAIALACWLAFHHLRLDRVGAEVYVRNDASCRVLEKNGFVLMGLRALVPPRVPQAARLWRYELSRRDHDGWVRDWTPRHERVELAARVERRRS